MSGEQESFVYKWINIETGKVYIGKHKGTVDDGYVSSGKVFLSVYNSSPHLFRREILAFGGDSVIYALEQRLIHEHISNHGYDSMYNYTTWENLKSWKRTCTHCGKIVDPRNEEWLRSFSLNHFENCKVLKQESDEKPKTEVMTLSKINRRINALIRMQESGVDPERTAQLRELRRQKRKLMR